MICKDEKTLEWIKHVVEAIVPSLVVHQGYDAKGPKDLPPTKTFGIWLPEDEGLSISDTLTLVSPYNAKISRRDVETKHSTKSWTFANHAEEIELQSIRWLSSGAVPEEKCKAASEPEDVIAIAKGWWNLWGNNGYSWAWHFSRYRKADDFYFIEVRAILWSNEVAISAVLRIKRSAWGHISYR